MDNLEKILDSLPKPKLRPAADLKIRLKLYAFVFSEKINIFLNFFRFDKTFYRLALSTALLFIVIFGATSFYAYANGNIVPGQKLYALKRAAEKVEAVLPLPPLTKAEIQQKFSQRRLNEAVILSRQNLKADSSERHAQVDRYIQNNMEEAVKNINSAASLVNDSKDQSTASETGSRLEASQSINNLDEIEKYLDSDENEELMRAINRAKEAIGKYQAIWQGGDMETNKEATDEGSKSEETSSQEINRLPEQPDKYRSRRRKPEDNEIKGIKIKNIIPAPAQSRARTDRPSPALINDNLGRPLNYQDSENKAEKVEKVEDENISEQVRPALPAPAESKSETETRSGSTLSEELRAPAVNYEAPRINYEENYWQKQAEPIYQPPINRATSTRSIESDESDRREPDGGSEDRTESRSDD